MWVKRELNSLNWEISQEIERELSEGRYHNGKAAVIQMLGRKPV
jgi:hypothetical protein